MYTNQYYCKWITSLQWYDIILIYVSRNIWDLCLQCALASHCTQEISTGYLEIQRKYSKILVSEVVLCLGLNFTIEAYSNRSYACTFKNKVRRTSIADLSTISGETITIWKNGTGEQNSKSNKWPYMITRDDKGARKGCVANSSLIGQNVPTW